ncbi:MAG: hypothetical protein ACI835_005578, partial [Planctomycetota bacterium]
ASGGLANALSLQAVSAYRVLIGWLTSEPATWDIEPEEVIGFELTPQS